MADNTTKQSQNQKASLFVSTTGSDKIIHDKADIMQLAGFSMDLLH